MVLRPLIAAALLITACSNGDTAETAAADRFPDVIAATAALGTDGTWTISATISSPYDTPERYADAWRVLGPDGTVFGVRVLTHDHADEQPFTRSRSGIDIPEGIESVIVEGRDLVNGWGGATVDLDLTAARAAD